MNILIVDDEISAIEAVKKGVNWAGLDIESIYTALSMKEAMDKLNQHAVDIMLCDIEMPMGTGLELLQWVNENKPQVICIFMTCHADFSYAQHAIRLGSLDYLLKPLSYEKVEAAISKAISKLKNERTLEKYSSAWIRNRETVIGQFWKDFFVGEIAPERSDVLRYIESKRIDIDIDKDYLPVLISIKKLSAGFCKDDLNLVEFAVKNMSAELFEIKDASKDIMTFNDNTVLIIFQFEKSTIHKNAGELVRNTCEELVKLMNQYFGIDISCYVGYRDSIYTIPGQIENLQVIDFNNVALQKHVYSLQTYKHFNYEYNNSVFKSWSVLIESSKFDSLLDEIRNMLTTKETLCKIDRKFLQKFAQDYYYILVVFARRQSIFLNELFGDNYSNSLAQEATASLDSLLQWVGHTIGRMKEYVKQHSTVYNPVDRTKKYVEAHLSEEITMEDIARNVNLNADYLTRIFKKDEGVSINRYIINRKIEKAKELLAETDKTIGEIALEVGYTNYSSFNRIFTKMVEMSPQEYKHTCKNNRG